MNSLAVTTTDIPSWDRVPTLDKVADQMAVAINQFKQQQTINKALAELRLAADQTLTPAKAKVLTSSIEDLIKDRQSRKQTAACLNDRDFVKIYDRLSTADQQSLLRVFRTSQAFKQNYRSFDQRFLLPAETREACQTSARKMTRYRNISEGLSVIVGLSTGAMCSTHDGTGSLKIAFFAIIAYYATRMLLSLPNNVVPSVIRANEQSAALKQDDALHDANRTAFVRVMNGQSLYKPVVA